MIICIHTFVSINNCQLSRNQFWSVGDRSASLTRNCHFFFDIAHVNKPGESTFGCSRSILLVLCLATLHLVSKSYWKYCLYFCYEFSWYTSSFYWCVCSFGDTKKIFILKDVELLVYLIFSSLKDFGFFLLIGINYIILKKIAFPIST